MDNLAQRLYGQDAGDSDAGAQQDEVPTDFDRSAGKMYPSTQSEDRASEPESQGLSLADRLYPNQGEQPAGENQTDEALYNNTDDPVMNQLRDFVKEEGLEASEGRNMARYLDRLRSKQQEIIERRDQEGENQIRQELGESFDAHVGAAKHMLNDLDRSGEVKEMLNSSRAGSHPAVVRFMASVARKLGY